MFMYDAYQGAISHCPEFPHFSIDDVDTCFNQFTTLKYYQSLRLTGNGEGITITPMNAGHILGGTLWKVSRESDDVLFCVDFNHKFERHLSGSHVEAVLRPSLVVADCLNFDVRHAPRSDRDVALLKSVMKCLNQGGDVLLPTDAGGRCLELLLVLHTHWRLNGLVEAFSLAFLSHTAKHTLEYANSMLEWMSEKCQKEFDQTKRSPFDFEFLRICTKLSDLDYVPRLRVVLATNPFMENGFSQVGRFLDFWRARIKSGFLGFFRRDFKKKNLFLSLAKNPANLVIMTQRAPESTIAGQLFANPTAESVSYTKNEAVPLQGEELEEYLQFQKEEELENTLRENNRADNFEEEVVVLDEIYDNEGKKIKSRNLTKQKIIQLYPMFVSHDKNVEVDDYGEFVDYQELFREPGEGQEGDDGVITVEFSSKNKQFIKRNEWNKIIKDQKHNSALARTEKDEKVDFSASSKIAPVKIVNKLLSADVRCEVTFIDFEGRSDGPSLLNILSQMAPRKLILLHGSTQNAQAMKRRLLNICESIDAPKIARKVEVASSSTFLKVVLDDRLARSLRFSSTLSNGFQIASFRGVFREKSAVSGLPMLVRPNKDEDGVKKRMGGGGWEGKSLFIGKPKCLKRRHWKKES